MPRLNVARVLSNPQFNDDFIVYRKTGQWVNGRFVESEDPIPFHGPTLPGGTKDIIQVPEADRTSEIRVFLSTKQMFVTHKNDGNNNSGTSDEIEYQGERYRIYQVKDWKAYGYYRAIGASMGGD